MLKNKGAVRYLNRANKALSISAILQDYLNIKIKNKTILDIGCGNGQIIDYFSNLNTCYAVDIDDHRTINNKNIIFREVKDESLPFKNSKFDIIISHHVIEHTKNQSLHLSEMYRVLKQNGLAYIACPNKRSPFMKGHIGNNLVLKPSQLKNLIKTAGFNQIEYYTQYISNPDKLYCDLKIGKNFPLWFIKLFLNWYPSQCYLLTKNQGFKYE